MGNPVPCFFHHTGSHRLYQRSSVVWKRWNARCPRRFTSHFLSNHASQCISEALNLCFGLEGFFECDLKWNKSTPNFTWTTWIQSALSQNLNTGDVRWATGGLPVISVSLHCSSTWHFLTGFSMPWGAKLIHTGRSVYKQSPVI